MSRMLAVRDDPRLAGQVVRYHTWPHIRQQSVGEHSWQVARIAMTICPERIVDLLPYIIMHDVGELRTGDVPYPIKADNPQLGSIMSDLESEALSDMMVAWMPASRIPTHLEARLRWVFKLCEFIEMWEWGLEELLRGNQFAELVAKRCADAIQAALDRGTADWPDWSAAVRQRTEEYCHKRRELWA